MIVLKKKKDGLPDSATDRLSTIQFLISSQTL
jgi:hypothetical protein